MKIIFIEEDQIEDLDDFICKKCDRQLVNKHYKINQASLIGYILTAILGFLFGRFGMFFL